MSSAVRSQTNAATRLSLKSLCVCISKPVHFSNLRHIYRYQTPKADEILVRTLEYEGTETDR